MRALSGNAKAAKTRRAKATAPSALPDSAVGFVGAGFRFMFMRVWKSRLRIGGGRNYNRVVLSLALCSRLGNFSRFFRAQMMQGPGTAKLQSENLRESEDAGQVMHADQSAYPAGESELTQHDHTAFPASIARFAMNNIYGVIKTIYPD